MVVTAPPGYGNSNYGGLVYGESVDKPKSNSYIVFNSILDSFNDFDD